MDDKEFLALSKLAFKGALPDTDSRRVWDEERAREREFNEGTYQGKYYRLMKYLPAEPEKLLSPVGTVAGNEDRVGLSEFSRTLINVDPTGQGFWVCLTPEGAAAETPFQADLEAKKHSDKDDPYAYAVFPVIGVPHNQKYFDEHPEVFSDFMTLDSIIIDEMQIIGDPIYEWQPTKTVSKKQIAQEATGVDKMRVRMAIAAYHTSRDNPERAADILHINSGKAKKDLLNIINKPGVWESLADYATEFPPTPENRKNLIDFIGGL